MNKGSKLNYCVDDEDIILCKSLHQGMSPMLKTTRIVLISGSKYNGKYSCSQYRYEGRVYTDVQS